MTEPTQTCSACGRTVIVQQAARGFPPDVAARKLAKLCAQNGHRSEPKYRAGIA